MSDQAAEILVHLHTVARLRGEHAADPALQARVQAVKEYQHRRFGLTYADLLASTRYAAAARFFLNELYGPGDFTQRDAQFERVVPGMTRIFPHDIVATVANLADLHALSEQLDSDMASQLSTAQVGGAEYVRAWRATGRRADRLRQIELLIGIGRSLDRFTRSRWLRQTLHLMRRPAQITGLAQLQAFLEKGFDTFGQMNGAQEFLATIDTRERALMESLFDIGPNPAQPAGVPAGLLPD